MLQIERRQEIVKYINEHQNVSTAELSDYFHTSAVTIRADIKALSQEGLIEKTYGGAASTEGRLNVEIPMMQKLRLNLREKQAIAARALDYVQPGDTILMDSGSTMLEMAMRLQVPNVTVITNDVLIAKRLIDQGRAEVYVTGGKQLNHVYALHGNDTENYLHSLHVDKLFMGCDALSIDWGISNRTKEEVATKRAMMQASKTVFAVADSTKMGKMVFARVCDIEEVDDIITDNSHYRFTSKELERLEKLGVRLDVCDTLSESGLD